MADDKTCSVHERIKRHKSLTVRIAIYFIVFGLVIGYFSYILTTIMRTQRLMHEQQNWALKEFSENFIRNHPDDFNLAEFILSNRADVAEFITAINQPAVKESAWMLTRDTDLRFFFYAAQKSEWRGLSSTDDNRLTIRPVSADIKNFLEKIKEQKIVSKSPLFWGQADAVIVFFRIYRDSQGNIFVLRAQDSRAGIVADLHRNLTQVSMFSVVLLLVSLLLGKLFARRVVRPVQELTEGAEAIAGGDYTRRFAVDREDEIGRLANSLNNMAHRFEDYIAQLKSRLDTLETMNLIDKAVLSSLSRDQLLYRVIGIVSRLFRASDVMLMLRDHKRKGYDLLYAGAPDATSGYSPICPVADSGPGATEKIALSRFRSEAELGEAITSRLQKFTHYEFSELSGEIPEENGLKKDLQGYFSAELTAIMSIPLEFGGNFYGSVLIARHAVDAWPEEQIQAARMLADQVAVALQSVRSFEERENLLYGILIALTRAIDAKSKWTAGHSDRVTDYALRLGRLAGLSGEPLEALKISAQLHDIGKIAVPEVILDKPDKLTKEEYDTIKTHPVRGMEIVRDITSYQSIIPGIYSHHEHWDGNGYPEGLAGEDIPLPARIITVADVYDAITDDRPYRKGMTAADALNFMREQSARLFDPELVNMFLSALLQDSKFDMSTRN